MINQQRDTISLNDFMTDYANEYGDQKLIYAMREWLNSKMGKDYEISCGMSEQSRKLLVTLSHEMLELSNKNQSEPYGYYKAIGHCMDLLIKHMSES